MAEASAQRPLEGLRLPEVPRHTLSASLEARLPHALTLEGRVPGAWLSRARANRMSAEVAAAFAVVDEDAPPASVLRRLRPL